MSVLEQVYNSLCCQVIAEWPTPYTFTFQRPDSRELNEKQFQSNTIKTTKYNFINFFPKSILLQYRRLANVYFIIIAIISTIPAFATTSPALVWFPLLAVLLISLIKEVYEDYQRYSMDKEVNQLFQTKILKGQQIVNGKWKQVIVGDIIQIKENQTFPADLLVISSSNPDGAAFIETASLDGQKGYKPKYAHPVTNEFTLIDHFRSFRGRFQGSSPSRNLYDFDCQLAIDGKQVIKFTGDKQLLYRGSKLKNTAWVWGLAIYTGLNTKVILNSQQFSSKTSTVQHKMNHLLLILLLIQITACFITSFQYLKVDSDFYSRNFYMPPQSGSNVKNFLVVFFIYLVHFSSIIPISLIVSVDLIKIAQSYFMDFDRLMYSKEKKRGTLAKCAALNEQLGQIQHIFTDKTGTLTKNQMVFKHAIIGNQTFTFQMKMVKKQKVYSCPQLLTRIRQQDPISINSLALRSGDHQKYTILHNFQELAEQYLLALLLANEIFVSKNELNEIYYSSLSPDQICFIQAIKSLNFCFLSRSQDIVNISINSNLHRVQILQKCEFTSDRKRMSVLVKWKGTIFMYLKGADNIVLDRLKESNQINIQEKVNRMSKSGLRTLLVAARIISPQQYETIQSEIEKLPLLERSKLAVPILQKFQVGLTLLGATGVIDDLQDEVSQVLKDFQRANIKVWMLTGDKFQTAHEVAKSCNLFQPNYEIFQCPQNEIPITQCLQVWQNFLSHPIRQKAALIIEGSRIGQILASQQFSHRFAAISTELVSVVCCRLLPLQKAQMVRMITHITGKISLAVGDGANDVSMIKQAHVGIGIYGQEGMNAAQASDFAIPQFRMLWRLLFVHGRWNYIRISQMILYFAYKSVLFTAPRFVFSFYCLFSGQPFFDAMYIALYNILFTSLPLIIRALFEQDVNYIYKEESTRLKINLEENTQRKFSRFKEQEELSPGFQINAQIRKMLPKAYFIGQNNEVFNFWTSLVWVIHGFVQGVVMTIMVIYIVGQKSVNSRGYNSDLWIVSITVYSCIILMVTFKLAIHSRHWSVFLFLSICLFSLAPYLSYMWISNYYFSPNIVGTITMSFTSAQTYLSVLLVCCFLLVIESVSIFIKFLNSGLVGKMRTALYDSNYEKIASIEKLEFSREGLIFQKTKNREDTQDIRGTTHILETKQK